MNRLVLLAAASTIVVSACGSGAEETTTTTEAPTTTAAPTELTLPASAGLPAGFYGPDEQPLLAGTYTTSLLEAPVTFTIPDGWTMYNDAEIGAAWIPPDPIELSYVAVVKFAGKVWDDPCAAAPPVDIENSALALIQWLDANPYLASSGIEEVTIGGQPGYQIEVEVTVPPECSDPPWLFLLALPVVGDYHLNDGMTARIATVDSSAITLFVSVESSTKDWEAMQAIADPFMDALVIG